MPLISVIVPVYKVEPYLHRCVDSILTQTFTDFELILVDDGSPDNCGAICDAYAASDSRVRVIHQENGGLSAARNAGIDWAFAHSDSQWLSFVDSDDWVHPCFLEYLYRAAEETKASVSACGFKRVEEYEAAEPAAYSSQVMAWEEFYMQDPVIGAVAWNKLYKKELFQELRYPVGKIHEDEFLTYKLLYRAGKVVWIPAELLFYFQNPSGIMKSQFSLKRLDGVDAIREQYVFAQEIKNRDLYLNRLRGLISKLTLFIYDLQKSDWIAVEERTKHIRRCRAELQRLLLRDGKAVMSWEKDKWIYEVAFPKLMWCYWTWVGVTSKIKRVVKRNADNQCDRTRL